MSMVEDLEIDIMPGHRERQKRVVRKRCTEIKEYYIEYYRGWWNGDKLINAIWRVSNLVYNLENSRRLTKSIEINSTLCIPMTI